MTEPELIDVKRGVTLRFEVRWPGDPTLYEFSAQARRDDLGILIDLETRVLDSGRMVEISGAAALFADLPVDLILPMDLRGQCGDEVAATLTRYLYIIPEVTR